MTIIFLDDDHQDFLIWRDGSGGTVEIFNIHVGSERRRGKGRHLVEALFREVGEGKLIWAVTRADNCIAQEFYEALRFRVLGVLREFYGARAVVDAVVYGRKSEGPV